MAHTDEELREINRPFEIKLKITELKSRLSKEYDYIGIKIAMGVATREEYADKISEAEEIRAEIRRLEEEV